MENLLNQSKHILIVGTSNYSSKLTETNSFIRTSVICRASEMPFLHRAQNHESIIVIKDDASVEQWIEYAKNLHRMDPIQQVSSFEELDQDKASAIADALNIKFHDADTIRWINDKFEMRKRLNEINFEYTPAMLVTSVEDIKQFAKEHSYPLILKPSKGKSSTGISVINCEKQIEQAFEWSTNATAPRLDHSTLMIEPLLEGREFSVEIISENGEHFVFGIVEKFVDQISKVEIGHVFPAELPRNTEESIKEYVLKFLDSINLQNGFTHTDVILTADGPKIIETHLKPPGDKLPELIFDSIGINCIQFLIDQEAGIPIKENILEQLKSKSKKNKTSAIWYSFVNFDGILETIQNKDEIKEMEGVAEFSQLISDGIHVSRLTSSYSRIAFVRTIHTKADQALLIAQNAIQNLLMFLSVRGHSYL
ncbi:ATP-grasp domain-containing protein [Gottfriedia luciferensis]|uniref:ATP-grasp domain-containing protein n=1 Tax=Gottfriedia luciferensis TaxID=178774 RepID=UPI0013029DE5|nr:ATP-grasp domain-containing protein [Gottfriedia luciferensis]